MKFAILILGLFVPHVLSLPDDGPLRTTIVDIVKTVITAGKDASVAPSGVPSVAPTGGPSVVPSHVPSLAPMDSPSALPSSEPLLNEDAFQKGLSELNLVGFTGAQTVSANTLTDVQGIDYTLTTLMPYSEMFSPDSFEISEDGMSVIHKATNETIRIPVFRSVFNNNTVVQLVTSGDGNVSFAEIRGKNSSHDTFFIQEGFASVLLVQEDGSNVSPSDSLLSFTAADVDNEQLAKSFTLGDSPPAAGNRILRGTSHDYESETLPSHRERRDAVSTACSSFKVVKIAAVYDSDLCGVHGSASATRSKIIAVVASASMSYERDMCVRLQLTDVYTPDSACGGRSKSFAGFDKSNICGGGGLIYDFANWMAPKRNSLGFDKNALVHLFTGMPKLSSTIGCAFTGGFCTTNSYGVGISTFSTNLLYQGIMFAHEVGHNLNAGHISDSSGRFNYIMEGQLTSGSDGFDQTSKNSILNYLAKTSCDGSDSSPTRPTTPIPPAPAPAPTSTTATVEGCRTKSEISAPSCITAQSSVKNGFACFALAEILPPFCSLKQLRWVLDTCDGISLRKRRNLSDKMDFLNGTSSSVLGNERNIPVNDTFIGSVDAISSFGSSYCAKTCIVPDGKNLCLSTSGGEHLVTVVALNTAGKQVDRAFKRILAVKSTSDGSCRAANVKCLS